MKAEATELFIQKNEIELMYMIKRKEAKVKMMEKRKEFRALFRELKAEKEEKLNEILQKLNYIDPLNTIASKHNEIINKMAGEI